MSGLSQCQGIMTTRQQGRKSMTFFHIYCRQNGGVLALVGCYLEYVSLVLLAIVGYTTLELFERYGGGHFASCDVSSHRTPKWG